MIVNLQQFEIGTELELKGVMVHFIIILNFILSLKTEKRRSRRAQDTWSCFRKKQVEFK